MLGVVALSAVLLHEPATLAGRAVDAETGDPLEGKLTFLGPERQDCRTDTEGRFDCGEVEPGRYSTLWSTGSMTILPDVEVAPGEARVVELEVRPVPEGTRWTIASLGIVRSFGLWGGPDADLRGVGFNLLHGVNAELHGIEVGLLNETLGQGMGVQVGLAFNQAIEFYGLQVAGFAGWVHNPGGGYMWGMAAGLQLCGVVCHADIMVGMRVAGVLSLHGELAGFEVSGLANIHETAGALLVAGGVNYMEFGGGVEIAGLFNGGPGFMGLQVAPINATGAICGLQVGAINVTRHLAGAQLGLLNVSLKPRFRITPVLNLGRHCEA